MYQLMILAQEAQGDLNLTLPGILALIAGILILIIPRLLNYIVAIYLIIVGIIMLFGISI